MFCASLRIWLQIASAATQLSGRRRLEETQNEIKTQEGRLLLPILRVESLCLSAGKSAKQRFAIVVAR